MARQKKTVFQTEWFSLEEEYFSKPGSDDPEPYYRLNSPDGAIVLTQTPEGEIIVVKQFRPAINQYTLEFPSGGILENESPEEAAARELYEETGYVCKDLHFLGEGRAYTDRNNSKLYAFLGTGAARDPRFQKTEDVDVLTIPPAEFKNLVVSGEFHQFAAIGLLVLADWKLGSGFSHS